MARNIRYNKEMFDAWLAERPACIQELARKYPPDRLYNYAPHNQKVTLEAYYEDNTVRILISPEFNHGRLVRLLAFSCSVFDVPVEKLTECDLPETFDNSNGDWVD